MNPLVFILFICSENPLLLTNNKLLGFIRRDNTNLVIDVSGVNEMVIAEVNNQGINWRNNQISSPEMRWIVESTRNKMGVSL